jgi:hypothetical protein
MFRPALIYLLLVTSALSLSPGVPLAAGEPPDELEAAIPRSAAELIQLDTAHTAKLAARLDEWSAELVWQATGPVNAAADSGESAGDKSVKSIAQLIALKQRVDGRLAELLDLRTQCSEMQDAAVQHEAVRHYLVLTSQLIDLSGRLRYTTLDAIYRVPFGTGGSTAKLEAVLDLLSRQRSTIGAMAIAFVLFEPAPTFGLPRFPESLQRKALDVMDASGSAELVPPLAAFLQGQPDAALALRAAEVLRKIGLPQSARPGEDSDAPPPAITPEALRDILRSLDLTGRGEEADKRRQELVEWLESRSRHGLTEESFRVNGFEVKSGDWLLMKNPSPYNRFTDLAPGLFTHAGVVTMETGSDGIRRCVLIDLPERGNHIPATNLDAYLERTVHYVFLRCTDAGAARRMGIHAATLIGHESQFDLNFRTDRVQSLKGRPLTAETIHTYCAGLLLLCAQETDRPRREFFPITERVAGGNCAANLARLGLSFGDDFVSPTGAVFSPILQIAGRRESMYSPQREIKDSIYDDFARSMIEKILQPSPDVYQSLRQQVAALAKNQPWLARALARANNVNEKMDLESAAKAAAVVETLDEIADRQMDDFLLAIEALRAGTDEDLTQLDEAARRRIQGARIRHAEVFRQWSEGKLSPRQLRLQLLNDAVQRGRDELESRFFPKK